MNNLALSGVLDHDTANYWCCAFTLVIIEAPAAELVGAKACLELPPISSRNGHRADCQQGEDDAA